MSSLEIPKVLLPNKNIDLNKWSVIACDQFTSQLDYWTKLKKYIGNEYSSLNLIFPEVYLNKEDNDIIVKNINNEMNTYLSQGIFDEYEGFIYVEREIGKDIIRKGLVCLIDLEDYDYSPKTTLPIRATERTVKERLPIRIDIRKDAPLELPHICIFMDDENNTIFSQIDKNKKNMRLLYDFDLNMKGGHITGYLVNNSIEVKNQILSLEKKGDENDGNILFVIGDGNHSLAAAKECWNLIRANISDKDAKSHPARFALCELQNIRDEAIVFEPIHRFISGAGKEFIQYLKDTLSGDGNIKAIYKDVEEVISVNSDPTIAIADIQKTIDIYIKDHKEISIDYIHGAQYLTDVVKKNDGVGIFMPRMEKSTLFDYVKKNGVMPRKSFSMGEAESKRYYLEAHKIR